MLKLKLQLITFVCFSLIDPDFLMCFMYVFLQDVCVCMCAHMYVYIHKYVEQSLYTYIIAVNPQIIPFLFHLPILTIHCIL